jgi:predicted transport protein
MAQSPEEMEAAMVRKLEEKTGRSLEAWIAVARASGEEKHGKVVAHLKAEHGLTHGYANLVAHRARQQGEPAPAADDLVAAQYAGKESLRPVYDAVLDRVRGFGGDVEVAAKKTYVSLRRSKQFAIVQPTTKTRVDVGIQLKAAAPAADRLQAGGFSGMVSHKVGVTSVAEVDDELVGWLRQAYERA